MLFDTHIHSLFCPHTRSPSQSESTSHPGSAHPHQTMRAPLTLHAARSSTSTKFRRTAKVRARVSKAFAHSHCWLVNPEGCCVLVHMLSSTDLARKHLPQDCLSTAWQCTCIYLNPDTFLCRYIKWTLNNILSRHFSVRCISTSKYFYFDNSARVDFTLGIEEFMARHAAG